MRIWMIRVRSSGKRYKPAYTNNMQWPHYVAKHYAAFMLAYFGFAKMTEDDFSFSWQKGVIKHSTIPYVQIKQVKDRQTPSSTQTQFEVMLPYFLPKIKREILSVDNLMSAMMYRHRFSFSPKDDVMRWHHGSDIREMSIDDGITFLYHEWAKDPRFFTKIKESNVMSKALDIANHISQMCGNVFSPFNFGF